MRVAAVWLGRDCACLDLEAFWREERSSSGYGGHLVGVLSWHGEREADGWETIAVETCAVAGKGLFFAVID